ncbi:helicase HerA domain-containing protein [Fusobacterium animalis]|uniref:VirB4 family type IV secretion/conjugal transfer ATPase n=1 Tax=Fusobacterium animalis TaxID=76859 RepID=UPI00325309EB
MNTIIFFGLCCFALMLFIKNEVEYNYNDKDSVSNYLPWGFLLGNGIIYNKNGSYLKCFKFRGKDLKSLEQVDLVFDRAKLNNAFGRSTGNNGTWQLNVESRRKRSTPYIKSQFKEKILQKMDDIRANKYNSGEFYESEFYLTLSWLPPADLITGLKDKLFEGKNEEYENYKNKLVEEFETEVRNYINLIKNVFREIKELNDEETLTYLHSCFSQNDKQNVTPARKEVMLDAYLSDTPIMNGYPPKIGDEYIGIVSILSFPNDTFPAMFDKINQLNFEFRCATRFTIYSSADGQKLVERKTGKWAGKRIKGLDNLLIAFKIKQKMEVEVNQEAENKKQEGDDFLTALQEETTNIGEYTFSVILKDKSPQNLNKKIEEVVSIIQNRGFTTVVESVNILEAFMGSMPADFIHNRRQHPLPTLVATDIMQFYSIYSGNQWNNHLNSCPLLYANSCKGSDVVYFNLHVGDTGHAAVFGETGGGKSVFLNLIASQFKKYKDSQVFIFDKGGSSRVLTTAIKGKFYDLGTDQLGFQPLANVDNELERTFAYSWLCEIFEQENIVLTPEHKSEIHKALKSVGNLPKDLRTITQFEVQVQSEDLRLAIHQYTKDGAFGRYFDSNYDSFTNEYSWQSFEVEKLMENSKVYIPILKYIFHKLEVEMYSEGKPTLLIIDEFGRLIKNKAFASKIEEWEVTLRKKNVAILLATQQLSDISHSDIKDALLNSFQTIIYLPNIRANNEQFYNTYKSFGLNNKQIEIIANLENKRDYYAVSKEGNLDFTPNLSEFELAFIGANSPQDQIKAVEIEKELTALETKNENWEDEFYKRWKSFKNLKENLEN